MNLLLVAPLLLSVIGAVFACLVPTAASPALCVRALSVALVISAGAVTAGLVLVGLAAASEIHSFSHVLQWCRALVPGEHGVSLWAGVSAGAMLSWSGWRVAGHLRQVLRDRRRFADVCGVEVVDAPGPVAFAVPGRPGGIVLGRQLLIELRSDERAAVLAHERAHLQHGHHRYVLAAELCAAAFPFLGPIARRVRFYTERWADETAATHVGSRELVARAIARAALFGADIPAPRYGLSLIGSGTAARVEALTAPRVSTGPTLPLAAVGSALAATVAGASVQLHHLAVFVLHICPT